MKCRLKALTFLLLGPWLVAALMPGCRKKCPPTYCRHFLSVTLNAVDNGDSLPHSIVNGAVYAKALLLKMHVSDSLDYSRSAPCASSMELPFLSSATAMYKEHCNLNGERFAFRSFKITCNRDFDPAHPADSNILDLFYADSKPPYYLGGDYDFYLMNEPADTGSYIFTATFVFDSSVVFRSSTQPVKLLK